MKRIKQYLLGLGLTISASQSIFGQNPLIRDQFTADPSARVFGDSVYIYPSHDIRATPGHGRADWFCMEDYHVFSSANLNDWKDHGIIVSQNKVKWVDSTSYSMWAPDCICRNGKYYFYFPTTAKESPNGKGFTVGVAVADKPIGPFKPLPEPINGINGIDPNVFIDKDGQAYLFWAQGNIYGAKLKDNMTELASSPQILGELPAKGLKEGPYLFERGGVYYLTYPHVENKTERLEYATSANPLGPFKFAGVIMDESASGCWTNHQSIIQFKNQWYLFYHNDDLSPNFDKNRSVRADSLFFNGDGTIRKVTQTLRGVGLTLATSKIQIDRYSGISDQGAIVQFIDTANKMLGWKATLSKKGAWIRYNRVDFGRIKPKGLKIMTNSKNGGHIEIHADKLNGPLIGTAIPGQDGRWQLLAGKLYKPVSGIHDLFVVLNDSGPADLDWITFNK